MAKGKSDYFGLSYIVSLILAIIPFTAWILGIVVRMSEGKFVAGQIRIFLGRLFWDGDPILKGTKEAPLGPADS